MTALLRAILLAALFGTSAMTTLSVMAATRVMSSPAVIDTPLPPLMIEGATATLS